MTLRDGTSLRSAPPQGERFLVDDLGNAKRFVQRCGVGIDGNTRPASFENARWRFDPRFSMNLNEHEKWLWFDPSLRMWRLKRATALQLFFGHIVENPPRKIAHLVSYRNEMLKAKAYFKRFSSGAVGGCDHYIIVPVNSGVTEFQITVRPDLQCVHKESLSDGGCALPSATGAGGASSPARKGGAA